MTLINILTLLLIILAAFFNACMDALYSNFDGSIFKNLNPNFWNPYKSWVNKWKNGDKSQGEKFFGSSTFLVMFTDGWHLLKSGMLLCIAVAISLQLTWILGVIFLSLFCGMFEITFRVIRK